jgi:opacity protein-like surface antigen
VRNSGLHQLLVAVAVTIASSLPAAAQDRLGWQIGAEGGANFSSASLSTYFETLEVEKSTQSSFSIGAVLDMEVNQTFSVQIEALYVERAQRLRNPDGPQAPIDANYRMAYIDVPMTLKARFLRGKARPYVFGGVVFGYLLSARSDNVSAGHEQEFDVGHQIRSVNYGLTAGAGLGIEMTPDLYLTMDGRYVFGLANVASKSDSWKTRDVLLLLGLRYGL